MTARVAGVPNRRKAALIGLRGFYALGLVRRRHFSYSLLLILCLLSGHASAVPETVSLAARDQLTQQLENRGYPRLAAAFRNVDAARFGDYAGRISAGEIHGVVTDLAAAQGARVKAEIEAELNNRLMDLARTKLGPDAGLYLGILSDNRDILQEALTGDFQGAGQSLLNKARNKVTVELKSIASGLVTDSLKYLLENVGIPNIGLYYLKIIELEAQAIEEFKRYTTNYFGTFRIEGEEYNWCTLYSAYRERGATAYAAFYEDNPKPRIRAESIADAAVLPGNWYSTGSKTLEDFHHELELCYINSIVESSLDSVLAEKKAAAHVYFFRTVIESKSTVEEEIETIFDGIDYDPKPIPFRVKVVNESHGSPVSGAEIQFDGNVVISNESGVVDFTVAPATFPGSGLAVAAQGFERYRHYIDIAYLGKHYDRHQGRYYIVVSLKAITQIILDVSLVDEDTRQRVVQEDAAINLDGEQRSAPTGRAKFRLSYQKLKLTRALITPVLKLEGSARGYLSRVVEIPVDAIFYQVEYHSAPIPIELPLKRAQSSARKAIELIVNIRDSDTKHNILTPVDVMVAGQGTKSTTTGIVEYRVSQAELEKVADSGESNLRITATAAGYPDSKEATVPVSLLLDKVGHNDHEHAVDIFLKKQPGKGYIAVAILPSSTSIGRNDTVTFQYRVSNPGHAPLSTISVTDDRCTPVNYTSGDADGDDFLAKDEVWWFECLRTLDSDSTNTAVAAGTDPSGMQVTDAATARVIVNECPPPRTEVPNIVGLDETSALNGLRDAKLDGIVISRVESETVTAGTVIEQFPTFDQCEPELTTVSLIVSKGPPILAPVPNTPLRAELDCGAGLEIEAGARPSRVCGVVVRGWKDNDEHVQLAVSHSGGPDLDVWPMEDAAWPPNMSNPGVADIDLKKRYIFSLNFSAPGTATPGLVPVEIRVTQGRDNVGLTLDVGILPPGRSPSRGGGIRPPPTVATGSGEYCVWRSKSFGDPSPCFKFNIAACGTPAYASNTKYELVGSGMTKLEASVRMKQLSPYGDDEYGCLTWKPPNEPIQEPLKTCPDGSSVPEDEPCPDEPETMRVCPNGIQVPLNEPCPDDQGQDDRKTCPDGTEVDVGENCPSDEPEPDDQGDGTANLDCSIYGANAEIYWDAGQQAHLCRCRAGYEFHASDRCVPVEELGQCLEYPGTYPSGDFCECAEPGHFWSQQAGQCMPADNLPETELVDCTAYPGSLPEIDAGTGEYDCACPSGTQWSDTLNRCATGSEENVAGLDCSSKPGTVPEMDYYLNQAVCRCPGSNETWSDSANACVDGSVAQTPGTQPEPPPPTTVQQGQCNDTARSGSNDPVRVQVEIANVGSLSLSYDTLQKEDRVRAFIDGTLVHDSGCVGTRGDVTQPIQVPPNARLMEVDVHPNCTGGSGTRWNFVVACDGAGR